MTAPEWWVRFEFAAPWLLVAVPLAAILLVFARGRGRRLVRFSSVRLADGVPATWRTRFVWLPAALLALGAVLAGVALARPRVGDERTVVRSEGIAIELVVDVSSSMWAHDLTGPDGEDTDRLSAVKYVVRDFVLGADDLPGRGGDRIGLTIFAGYADAVCPLTLDHDLLLETLDAARIAQARYEDGTSIGLGLAAALGRLEDDDTKSRVVILLTDGVHNDPETDPMEAAGVAKELGIRVYTIGVGKTGWAKVPVTKNDGSVTWSRQPVQIDEELLTAVARETGAMYRRAGSTVSLRDIYAEIDRLERTELEGITYRRWRELFTWPLTAGVLCWLLSLALEAGAFRRLG